MNIQDLIIKDSEHVNLQDLFLSDENRGRIEQLIKEHQYRDELLSFGLPLTNKVLLHGSSGCGKTSTAKGIAKALDKPLVLLNLSNVV
ncbi:MAG: AAA family ATPase, partial [Sphingobacterium sp.]